MDVAMAQRRRSGHRRAEVPRRSVRDLILWLGEPACHERARVGGKAATLSRLAAAYRVPLGFCLTTAAYALAEARSLTHQEGSRSPVLAVALYDALATAYQRLADRAGSETPAVAVRSSAIDEDGGMASYAGQHETSLNIVGVEAVTDAVVRCWRSAWSPRARAYRCAQALALGRAWGGFTGSAASVPGDLSVLRGTPGSPGLVRGAAKVVRSLGDAAKLGRGDILVAETTAPPWTPLFATVAAVITATGGLLSHSAIVAREYRIPAVVGIGGAAATVHDGQLLEVDGDAGVVRVVGPA